MKLIYIYGIPAVGKLSVGEQLEKITNFKLFHSHLTADYVSTLFPARNKMSDQLKQEIAYKMFEAAAKNNINLIFTLAHQTHHDSFVKKIIKIVQKYKGEILFVRLICEKRELSKRITQNSRKKFKKATSLKELEEILKRNSYRTIPFKKSLIIDNTRLSPKKCAQKIKEYYRL
ncbi:MAG: AAA family ATPase [Candidatus Nanoarchaeia archaeon]|nr:AAA family ATPase [Candidatus Nanoarchaeia archaeon]